MSGRQNVKFWPTNSNHWPTITSTDLDPSLYGLVVRAHKPVIIASPDRFINFRSRCLKQWSSDSQIALFIDGTNLYATAKTLGFDIDYKRLLKEFQGRGVLLRAYYYTAVIEDQEYTSMRPLIDWLDYNGYTVVTKATKEFIDASGHRKVKGNMKIELAVDAMELAAHVAVDILDMHLLEPTRLYDARDPDSIVAVAVVDLHLEYRLGMTRVDTDHWQAKSLERGP
jgi:hypothetical protein